MMEKYFEGKIQELREAGYPVYDALMRVERCLELVTSEDMLGVFENDQEQLDAFVINFFDSFVERLKERNE